MDDYLAEKEFTDSKAWVIPLTFGRARIIVGPKEMSWLDDGWWYDSPEAAVAALNIWNGVGEPEGWMRNPKTGRRRPNGDKSKEYVSF